MILWFYNIWSLSWVTFCDSCAQGIIWSSSSLKIASIFQKKAQKANPKTTNAKCKEKSDLVIYLAAIFAVSIVTLNLLLTLSFAFSTEISKLPFPLPPLRTRGPLQILPVVVNCKLSMFELREVLLRMNYCETVVLIHCVTRRICFTRFFT